eukprot:4016218-Karenia_brevis.AAC.1
MASVYRALTNKQLKLLHNQQLYVDTHTFSQRCTFKWARHVKRLAQELQQHHNHNIAQWPQHNIDHHLLCTPHILFTCPHGHHRVATQPTFDAQRPSKPVWCATCRHSWGGAKWLCPCAEKWNDCSLHYNNLRPQQQLPKRARTTTIAATPTESAAKKAKLEPAKPAIGRLAFTMGAKLASKFGHLQQPQQQ